MAARENERRDPAKVVAGSALVGVGELARAAAGEHHGIQSPMNYPWAVRSKGAGEVGRHALKYAGTRALIGAGVPLAVSGLRRERRGKDDRLSLREDVLGEIGRRAVALDLIGRRTAEAESARKRRERRIRSGYMLAGVLGGSFAGSTAARRIASARAGRKFGDVVGMTGTLGAAGTIAGGSLGSAAGDYHNRRFGGGRSSGEVSKLMSRAEEEARLRQRNRRKTQEKIGLTSATMGVGALALRAPQLVRIATNGKGPARFIALEHSLHQPSDLLGVGATGVGSFGALNSAHINRGENEIEEKYVVKKDLLVDRAAAVSKAMPRVRPRRFGGVRRGGMYRTAAGGMGYRRGSVGGGARVR